MKLVGCRGCGNLVGSNERRCPFCDVVMAMPSSRWAGTVLAGLMLSGCADKSDTLLDTDTDPDASDTDRPGSSDPYGDPPNSEATYGVPATDSDWYGTESSSESSSSSDDSSSGAPHTDTDTDTDTDGPVTESDGDTDTDTDGPATATDSASSDGG